MPKGYPSRYQGATKSRGKAKMSRPSKKAKKGTRKSLRKGSGGPKGRGKMPRQMKGY